MYRWCFIVLLVLLSRHTTFGQEKSFIFSNLKEENGLSYNVVNCFLKDSRGVFWIGTYNGFSRYDGSNFYNYKIRKGTNSLTSEVIHSLCEDRKGDIWGATDNGVFHYLLTEDRFINYEISSLNRNNSFGEIICDAQGEIWAKGGWSVFKYNRTADKFEELIKLAEPTDNFSYFRIFKNGFLEDPTGKGFWMATSSGLAYYNKNTRTVTDSRTNPSDSLFKDREASALSFSPTGTFWFYDNTSAALISFDPVTKKITRNINMKDQGITGQVASTFEDRNHRLWLGSWGYDMLVIDLARNNEVLRIEHKPEDSRSVASTFFWDAYQDNDNTIWLGTLAGISRCNPERNIYKEYKLPDFVPAIKHTSVWFPTEDPVDKSLWVITEDMLLINFNPQTNRHTIIDIKKAVPAPSGVLPGMVNALQFYKNQIIIPTYTGTWKLERGATQLTPYTALPAAHRDFISVEILFSGDSVTYFNNGRQLLYWNRLTGYSELISYSPHVSVPAEGTIISGLMQGKDGKIWMVGPPGYIAFLDNNRKPVLLKIEVEKIRGSGYVWGIDDDSKGNLWITYRGYGLFRYQPGTKKFSFWNEPDGLPGNRIHRSIVDKEDRVWSIMYNKLSVYIPKADKFYSFKIPYSESNYDYINFLSKKADGHLLGTIKNEVFEFYPERLLQLPQLIKPQISQVNVAGKEVNLFLDEHIKLKPTENTIRFHFGCLISKEIFPYDLEYKLEGAEKEWTLAGDNHEALYNNLPPGDYTFMVKATGKNNAWETQYAELKFTIKTPFYKSKWFFAGIVVIILGLLYLVYRYRLAQKEKLMLLENKAQALEKDKALVMYEGLKQQLNPHFLFNSLTSLNSLINSDPKIAGSFLDSLSKTYRYILKSRDSETVALGDELKFADNYIKLQRTRFEKGFEVNINVPEEFHDCKIVPVTLQNLIENAIKHNIIDEESPLVVDIYIEDGYLIVQNNLQRKNFVETSNQQGLSNLQSLYSYLSNRPMEIKEDTKLFMIKIPLL